MRTSSSKLEKKLFSQGYGVIAGVDEAGRGAWAGPLIAGALILSKDELSLLKKIKPLRDSKMMTPLQRERAYEFLTKNFSHAHALIEHALIDKIGISRSNQRAMDRAIANLSLRPQYILADGRGFSFSLPFKNIIDGDAKIATIAAASIIAKVTRDHIMISYSQKYSQYFFSQNKGYGTKKHQEALKKYGICPIHRLSYRPIKELLDR